MQIEDIERMIREHEGRIKKLEEIFNDKEKITVPQKDVSINEFINKKAASDDLRRTATFAYFLDKHEAKKNFNYDDIIDCFKRAREKLPQNVSDKINKCIKKCWISESNEKKDGKKSYYITNTGITAVETDFKNELKE
jgi:hypothetical protein